MTKKATAQLAGFIREVPERIQVFSEEELMYKPAPNKWSKKEILGHLIDSARNNLVRFTRVQISPQPYYYDPYPQDELVRVNNYQEMDIQDIINLWVNLNIQIHRVNSRIPEEILHYEVILRSNPPVKNTLQWLIEDYTAHMEHHLKQIFGDTLYQPVSKNTRKRISVEEALKELKALKGAKFATLLKNKAMSVEIYVPEKVDLQSPHKQDELYVVIEGSGFFVNGDDRHAFQKGDVLFVPAGVVHRFEDFSDDFKTWVIFY